MLTELVTYIVLALSIWAHPGNTINPVEHAWIAPEFGIPAAGTADAWPGRDGFCHIRVDARAWMLLNEERKTWTMEHEVGHCLGLWEHDGDGVMAGYREMTAYDLFRVDALHQSPLTRRAFLPGLSR